MSRFNTSRCIMKFRRTYAKSMSVRTQIVSIPATAVVYRQELAFFALSRYLASLKRLYSFAERCKNSSFVIAFL